MSYAEVIRMLWKPFAVVASVVRPIAVLPLIVGGLLASPALGTAQCWTCGWSELGPWPNHMCKGGGSGAENCAQEGRSHDHSCETDGGPCEDELFAASEQEAIDKVMAGEMLLASGRYFFVADGDETVVVRKCNRVVVARIPGEVPRQSEERLGGQTDMRMGGAVAAADRRAMGTQPPPGLSSGSVRILGRQGSTDQG